MFGMRHQEFQSITALTAIVSSIALLIANMLTVEDLPSLSGDCGDSDADRCFLPLLPQCLLCYS